MFPGGARSAEHLLEIIRQLLNGDITPSGSGGTMSIMRGLIDNTTLRTVRVDPMTHAINVILYEHHEIHDGRYFFIKGFQDVDGAGTNLDFLFSVPNATRWPHADWHIDAEAEFSFYLYEDVETSDDGTPVTPINANRNSANVSTLGAFTGPTLAGGALGDGGQGGTLIRSSIIGSGKDSTLSRSTGYEFIGRQNTKYWFRFTKTAAGTHWIDYDFNWYEHISKD